MSSSLPEGTENCLPSDTGPKKAHSGGFGGRSPRVSCSPDCFGEKKSNKSELENPKEERKTGRKVTYRVSKVEKVERNSGIVP